MSSKYDRSKYVLCKREKYEVLDVIGDSILRAVETSTRTLKAIKYERTSTRRTEKIAKYYPLSEDVIFRISSGIDSKLRHEVKVYIKLSGVKGVLKFYEILKLDAEGEFVILVLDLQGPSLQRLHDLCQCFSMKTTLQLADQLIERMEGIHTKIYHRNVEPSHFLVGQDTIYIIGFSLAQNVTSRDHGHRPCGRELKFASLNSLADMDVSRRDDLESVSLMLISFVKGSLPWSHLHTQVEIFAAASAPGILEVMTHGLPPEFGDFLMYCRSLSFEEAPAYARWRKVFKELLAEEVGVEADEDGVEDSMNRAVNKWDWDEDDTFVAPVSKDALSVDNTAAMAAFDALNDGTAAAGVAAAAAALLTAAATDAAAQLATAAALPAAPAPLSPLSPVHPAPSAPPAPPATDASPALDVPEVDEPGRLLIPTAAKMSAIVSPDAFSRHLKLTRRVAEAYVRLQRLIRDVYGDRPRAPAVERLSTYRLGMVFDYDRFAGALIAIAEARRAAGIDGSPVHQAAYDQIGEDQVCVYKLLLLIIA